MRFAKRKTIAAGTVGIILWYASNSFAQPLLAIGPDAEVTSEDLHRVDRQIIDAAWVRSDLDLSQYTRVLYMPATVLFRDVRGRYNALNTNVENFPVTDQNKERLRTLFGETFYEYVGSVEPFEMSDTVARDVLMVQGFLVDVVSGVPPDIVGRTGAFIRRPWEASVTLELRDSMSNTILARTVDRQRVEGRFDLSELPRATQFTVEGWSDLLRTRINELLDLGGGGWSRCQLHEQNCTP